MNKSLLPLSFLVALACSPPKTQEEQMIIPAGMSIHSQFTSRMGSDDLPVNDISYIIPSMENVTIYSSFAGITAGNHTHQWILADKAGQVICPTNEGQAESYYEFQSPGGTQNVWSRIAVKKCLPGPGDYIVKIYLDGNLVLRKDLKVLSPDEENSGQFEPYWNEDKYPSVYPAAKGKLKGDWIVRNLVTDEDGIIHSNLFVAPHRGFNRIFVVREIGDQYFLTEWTNYGWKEVYAFRDNDEPWFIQYHVAGDELYFYNAVFKISFNLISSNVQTGIALPFEPAPDNGFRSPSGEHTMTRDGLLDGKPLMAPGTCPGGVTIRSLSWSSDEQRVFYLMGCGNMETLSGFYQRSTLGSGQAQRLMEDFEWMSTPVYFDNNGTDFFALVEDEEGAPPKVKVATQVQYFSESGFGTNFYRTGVWGLPLEVQDQGGASMNVDFLSMPLKYLSYEFADEAEYSSGRYEGSIEQLGTIKDGPLAGEKLYRLFDLTSEENKNYVPPLYGAVDYTYLVRHNDELIGINLNAGDRSIFTFPDMDGKRRKSDLFKGATKLIDYKNLYIPRLLATPELAIPNSTLHLKKMGNVKIGTTDTKLRKIFDHPIEGPIYVKQSDDGSFWSLNFDLTATLYSLPLDFGVVIDNNNVSMEEYVPYSNRGCLGNPLDFMHVLSLDPSRLRSIGTTSRDEPIYGFVTDGDDILKQEYEALKTAYGEYGEAFKSFEDFMKTLPLFLWKDPLGRYVRFVRKEYLMPANCEPIMYLYPQETTDVEVELGEKVNVIASRPMLTEAWHVRAEKDGHMVDLATNKWHDRIFWEGISDHLPPLQKGFAVDTSDLSSFLDEKLAVLGLNQKEASDFKQAWLKEFKSSRYYFIGFYEPWVINKYAPLEITPTPETVVRILIDYRPMETLQVVEEPEFPKALARKGFVVVEWGGVKR